MELELIAEFKAHPRHAQAVAFSPDGDEVVTTGMDALAQVWSVPSFDLVRTFSGHDKSVNSAAIAPDGKRVMTGSTDRTAIVWDWESGDQLVRLAGHRNTLAASSFSPSGDLAVTASYDGRIGFWSDGADTLEIVVSHPRNVTCVSFSPDGGELATSGIGNVIKIWDVDSREVVREIEALGQAATGCLFMPGGQLLCWTYEGHLVVLSPEGYETVSSGQMEGGGPNSVATVASTGLLMCSVGGGVRLVDSDTLETVAAAKTGIKGMYGVASSADGSMVAAVSADGRLRVWSVTG